MRTISIAIAAAALASSSAMAGNLRQECNLTLCVYDAHGTPIGVPASDLPRFDIYGYVIGFDPTLILIAEDGKAYRVRYDTNGLKPFAQFFHADGGCQTTPYLNEGYLASDNIVEVEAIPVAEYDGKTLWVPSGAATPILPYSYSFSYSTPKQSGSGCQPLVPQETIAGRAPKPISHPQVVGPVTVR